jgi:hypothetical protein
MDDKELQDHCEALKLIENYLHFVQANEVTVEDEDDE